MISDNVRPWLFSIFLSTCASDPEASDHAVCQQSYDEYLARWARADEQGFEGLVFRRTPLHAVLAQPLTEPARRCRRPAHPPAAPGSHVQRRPSTRPPPAG